LYELKGAVAKKMQKIAIDVHFFIEAPISVVVNIE